MPTIIENNSVANVNFAGQNYRPRQKLKPNRKRYIENNWLGAEQDFVYKSAIRFKNDYSTTWLWSPVVGLRRIRPQDIGHWLFDGILNLERVKNKGLLKTLLETNAMEAHKFGKFVGDILEQEGIEDNKDNRDKMTENIIEKNMQELQELIQNKPEYGKDIDIDTVQKLLKEKLLGQSGDSTGEGEGDSESEQEQEQEQEQSSAGQMPEHSAETDVEWVIRRLKECREYLNRGDAATKDVVSNAAYKMAGRMLRVGIPKEAVLYSYAMTWPERVRMELDIPKYDPRTFEHEDYPHREGQHRVVPYVEALVDAGVPAMLVGPTQAGKGYLSRNIAENREVPYGSVPLSAGTSIAWLFGRNMPQGYVGTDFVRCYESGGVFLLDEMDAADANLLIGINDALSNDQLANPVIDLRTDKHKDFIPIAAANTFGLGADADYTGRERLDMATLERWRMGRVEVDYDRELQIEIIKNEAGDTEAAEAELEEAAA